MLESLIGTIAIVALIIVVARQNSRIGLLEREIGALRSFVLAKPVCGRARRRLLHRRRKPAPTQCRPTRSSQKPLP